MLKVIRLFLLNKEANPYLVVSCLLLASLAEAVGIGTLLPVISIVASGNGEGGSALASVIDGLFEWVGFTPSLGGLVLIVTAFMLLKAALTYAAMAYAVSAASRVSLALRKRLAAAIMNARWRYFSDQRSGKIANTIGREASQAGDAYVTAASVVAAVIQVAAYAVIAIAISPALAFFALAAGTAITLILQHYVKVARRAGYQQTDRMATLTTLVVDMLANIKPLKSMQRQNQMLGSVYRVAEKLRHSFIKKELSKAGLARGGDSLRAIAAALGIYVGSAFLAVPFAELLVSAIVFNQIISVVSKLQRLVQVAVSLESSYVRVLQAIEEAEAECEVNSGHHEPDAAHLSCRFEGVGFSYSGRPILNSVDIVIPAQAITVLSGPSGAGKTTIVDLLIGLHQTDEGRILIGSHPISEIDLAAWRKQIGYVPQELTLFHDTIRMNLTLGDPSISDADVALALRQAGAADFVSDLPQGLDTDVGEMGGKLSGGQRQRISLARALVVRPKILILDEVTSALDPITEAEIVDNIAQLRGHYTIVAITHRPAWTRVADKLYSVEGGRVVEVVPAP